TGTHDNHTLRGWVKANAPEHNAYAMQYLNVKKESRLPKAMLRAAWASIADLALATMQDLLDAPPSARINTPSTLGGNWIYRTQESDYSQKLCKKLRKMNETYGRCNAAAVSQDAGEITGETTEKGETTHDEA
ncbi:MAG: 4-alpha-glucanotransferase, partial [Oscillospiraceae bacterium]|nr:4-alpha-glucanotransferase [Oscillospiraceae bacterium]